MRVFTHRGELLLQLFKCNCSHQIADQENISYNVFYTDTMRGDTHRGVRKHIVEWGHVSWRWGQRNTMLRVLTQQERENIILSLVRSNEDGDIGFLKDHRRMNVAITRAKEKLFVIGDSATIAADVFFNAFLTYIEKYGVYRSVWELEL